MAQLAARGHKVVVLTLTSGDLAGAPAEREAEEIEAMRRLGAEAVFARLPDGFVSPRAAITAIDEAVDRYAPGIVLAHSAGDTHQDHVATFNAARVSCRRVATFMTYESPSSLGFEPTTTIDVSDAWERKSHALAAYTSQIQTRQLMAWVDSIGRFRAWPRHVGAFCESLRLCHSRALPGFESVAPFAGESGRLLTPAPESAHAR